MPEKLTAASVDRHCRAGVRTEIADTAAPGLVLRVNAGSSSFVYRWTSTRNGKKEKVRLVLGTVEALSLAEARPLAHRAADLVRQGFDPDDEWLRRERSPQEVAVVRKTTWNWTEAVDIYLAEIGSARKQATYDDYRKSLRHKVFIPFRRRYVADVTDEELSEALATLQRRQKGSAAAGLKRRLSAFWTFLQRMDNRSKSGVKRKLQIDLPPIRSTTKALRFPHPAEVAALYKTAMAGKLKQGSRAVALLCLTAQRRETVVTARQGDVHDGLWHVPPAHRKTAAKRQDNRLHVLPWPDEVSTGDDETWVFPAARPRRAGAPLPHLASSTLTHALLDKKVGFSPHDVRRSFATAMRMNGFTEADVALVIDHNEGPSTVMSRHYDAYADLPRKREMLDIWWSYVLGKRKISAEEWAEATGQRRGRQQAAE